jgi:8-oxo-dGTP pyrophosphatase MutT (NUDIX family)
MSYKDTAIRETFEETGILLAEPKSGDTLPSDQLLDAARKLIHAGKLKFATFLRENGHINPSIHSRNG